MCLNKNMLAIVWRAKMQGDQQDRGWGRLIQKSRQGTMIAWTVVAAVDEKNWTDLRVSGLRGRNYQS